MSHLFLSYSHKDKDFVKLLKHGLKIVGYRPWRDEDDTCAGQTISKEVEFAIDNAAVFIPVVSEHFEASEWMANELARARDSNVPVVPILFNGAKIPIQLQSKIRIRVDPADGNVSAAVMFDLLSRLEKSLGTALAHPAECDDSGWGGDSSCADDFADPTVELREALSGTRWTWCENAECMGNERWIEFHPDGTLTRSWRADLTRWAVTPNGFVSYKPHLLLFDLNAGTFQGAVADATDHAPERSGRRLKQ